MWGIGVGWGGVGWGVLVWGRVGWGKKEKSITNSRKAKGF